MVIVRLPFQNLSVWYRADVPRCPRLDPECMPGPTGARVLVPLGLAESLHVMQPTDQREISRAASDQPVYSSVNVLAKNPARSRTSKTPSRK
jgi:hypothetical protein